MSQLRLPAIAITTGEPAGVGPELSAALAGAGCACRLVLIGDRALLEARGLAPGAPDWQPGSAAPVSVLQVPLRAPAVAGRLDAANARYVLDTLDRAIAGCLAGEFAAMVTAPLHKGVINDAGVPFSGHTEYLAERTGAAHEVMMLVGGGLRVALATTHLPLAQVPAAITADLVFTTLRVIDVGLRRRFRIAAPRILVAGLNPHAGEGGHMGREDIDAIAPAIRAARGAGIAAEGPLPADTIFLPQQLARGDCVLAMYHDQGLPVLKYAGFGHGVNVTLGLPIVRTSVDHGTALDLAGSGRADPGSLHAALDLALELAARADA